MRRANTYAVSPLIVLRDLGEPIEQYRVDLSDTEWCQVETFSAEKRRRHFVLGRRAARLAIRHVLGSESQPSTIEIVSAKNGAPQVMVNGQSGIVSVALSHSASLAFACAWRTQRHADFSIGVDVERLRMSQVATSPYAFSNRERTLLSHLAEKRDAGIVAWSIKESVWKALRPNPDCGPESIEIGTLNLSEGCADVQVKYGLVRRLGKALIQTSFSFVQETDGEYILSYAVIHSPNMSPINLEIIDLGKDLI